MRIAFTLIASLMLVAGCGRRGPLDNATLDVLSRTGMHGADVTYPDGYQASLVPDDYDQMRNLISALAPIKWQRWNHLRKYVGVLPLILFAAGIGLLNVGS